MENKRLYIEYKEHRSGGEYEDGEEWFRTDTNIEIDFIRFHRQSPKNHFFYDSVEVVNDKLVDMDSLYLAVVRYSGGGTFGKTFGEWEIIGVAPTHEIAKLMLEEALKSPEYKTWDGYFNTFTGTEIHELDVE